MRSAIVILGLAAAAFALAPRSAAQDLALLGGTAPATTDAATSPLEPETPPVFASAPFVGVERSTAFRVDDARRLVVLGRPAPLTFAEQAASGIAAFHLTVYADPSAGRYARGAAARRQPALAQAGLKVVDPEAPDPGALCATLMTCLAEIDALAAATPGGHVVVVVDAQAEPAPEPKLLRVAGALVAPPNPAPEWERLLTEIGFALPALEPSRLSLVLVGGAGAPPTDRVSFLGRGAKAVLVDGEEARVFRADADPAAVAEAVMSGALVVVIGADAAGDGDPTRLGPREAASLGAHVVIVTSATARMGG